MLIILSSFYFLNKSEEGHLLHILCFVVFCDVSRICPNNEDSHARGFASLHSSFIIRCSSDILNLIVLHLSFGIINKRP